MKSKLYLLFALLALTAVFAAPALAAPPVPTITNLHDGDVVNAGVSIWVETAATADTVEVVGLDGVHLGHAQPVADSNGTIWTVFADLGAEDDSPSYPLTVTATNADGASSTTVLVQLDKVPSPAEPFWLSPNESGLELSNELDLRTITGAGIDYVEYLVDGVAVGHGIDTSPGGSSTWDYSLDLELYELGEHTLTAVAHVGDEFSIDSNTTITIVDGTSPVIAEILPADGSVVSGTVQLVASITDNRGVQSAEYSIDDGQTWRPLVRSVANETIWQSALDTTELPNGQTVVYVRAFDANGDNYPADAGVVLDVANPAVPVLDIEDVEFFGSLMVEGPGIVAEGATATGFPEPDISYGWFVCETPTTGCTFHDTLFYTPTAAELGSTVSLVVRATNTAPMGSVSKNILVGTVFAAPVDPPADAPADSPADSLVDAPSAVIPVKSPEVVKAEVKVVEAVKSVEEAKAQVEKGAKEVAAAKTVVTKAKQKTAAAKTEVKEAKAEVKAETKDVAEAKTRVKKAKKDKKNAAKKALAKQAKELAASQREALAAAKAEEAAKQKLAAALKAIENEQREIAAAQKKLEASQAELVSSQKELDTAKKP